MIQSYCAPRSSPVRSCTAYWTSGTKPSGRIEAHLSRSCRRRRAATRSPRRPTTGAGEAEAAAASGRGPTRPPAPARVPWGDARVFGDLDAWIWGRSDGGDARSGVDIYAICFFRSGFRVVVAAPDCVSWSGGDGDAATGGEGWCHWALV